MTLALGAGILLGGSLCLLVYALVPPRPTVGVAVARWERRRSRRPAVSATAASDRVRTLGRGLDAALAARGITLERLRGNLELSGGTMETHLVQKFGLSLLGFLLPSLASVGLRILSVGNLGLVVPAVLGVPLAIAFFFLPDYLVAQKAEQRRTELRRALSCYLDLAAMSLAGGRGLPETIPSCAQIGTGWAFETLQDTISRARYRNESAWEALEELGERTQLTELQDLGGALTLVAEDGSKVRETLTSRAVSQRKRQLAEAEGAAEKADQSISTAQILLALGFFVFLGYPALEAILSI